MNKRINQGINAQGDDALWAWFENLFRLAFTDTTKHKDALTKLLTLRMTRDDLDSYITNFNNLRETSGWERDSQGTLLLFQRGLKPALANVIIHHMAVRPVNFEEWCMAARWQHVDWVETKAVMGTQNVLRNNGFNSPRWNQVFHTQQRPRPRDPDAMDVDAANINITQMQPGRLSEEERKQLQNEGRCFFCKNQGHISCQCPKKMGRCTENPSHPRPLATQVTETDDATVVNTVDAEPDRMAILKGIQGMLRFLPYSYL
jgi:hypothetical protein